MGLWLYSKACFFFFFFLLFIYIIFFFFFKLIITFRNQKYFKKGWEGAKLVLSKNCFISHALNQKYLKKNKQCYRFVWVSWSNGVDYFLFTVLVKTSKLIVFFFFFFKITSVNNLTYRTTHLGINNRLESLFFLSFDFVDYFLFSFFSSWK